ncbi:MAG: hypothetical protein Q8P98_02930 [Candidatus Rokubacteria bacterium]|nr:hypothetical protein [Candidatus Rokubacteria bacterium]
MSYIYRPKLKSGEPCRIWWMQYYVNGQRVKESTHSAKEREAKTLLKEREGRVAGGEPIVARMDRVTYETCRADPPAGAGPVR